MIGMRFGKMKIIQLKENTIKAVSEVKKNRFFENVGVKVTDETVIQVFSWNEAIKAAQSEDWDYASLESANLCRDVLVTKARERYQKWNDIVFTVKELLKDELEDIKSKYDKAVWENVAWVLVSYLLEKEYEDIYPDGYYQQWMKWYFAGHHVCGWQGAFPEGKLIIF